MPNAPLLSQRAAGVLLHPTSLPGPHGSGDLGRGARDFVDFLATGGQRWWQMLPITPIGAGHSPYSSPSALAGNPLLIDLEALVDEGLLARTDVRGLAVRRADRVSYARMIRHRMSRLRRAWSVFAQGAGRSQRRAFERYARAEASWLDDYALFAALKQAHGGKSWLEWPRALSLRDEAALARAADEHADAIGFVKFTQYLFDAQWAELRAYAGARGVGLIGDLPMFVSHDSADVWAQRDHFLLDERGRPRLVSGTPPDNFSATGQLWGHPLYDWAQHRRAGFAWWVARMRSMQRRFHATRIDHFLGFHRCWAVPARARLALAGDWMPSPGEELFSAVRRKLGRFQIIAEDLGAVVPEALALRDRLGLPGMRVLQYGFGGGSRYDQPHNYPRECVAYPGTHDNHTFVGWFKQLPRRSRALAAMRGDAAAPQAAGDDGLSQRERAARYLGATGRDVHIAAIRALYASVANVVIVPLQDWLGLDDRARMNVPATASGNWEWRVRREQLTPKLARRMAEFVETFERGA